MLDPAPERRLTCRAHPSRSNLACPCLQDAERNAMILSVEPLGPAICPANIAWLVPVIVVDPVKRDLPVVGPGTDIGLDPPCIRPEVMPLRTDCYAPAAVVLVLLVIRFLAPAEHCYPCAVQPVL